ncbi:hypothetical protein H310_10033 [Aphanomyces invadans]|uniref:Uncharacterized protein n=1 Tax=Aphanomyces invadans TaxID=157072 RepID=A0A024TSV8_9STRA|nr:hypothetical protein H310_10033 [Aphanomyces invadans]ETV96716.1 hypothetical protein H310_10033 [Aphanomyces invadans]|eukprot:XP_008874493.1 hypothetical protein H310_10033 [Aphanomyces invadans]
MKCMERNPAALVAHPSRRVRVAWWVYQRLVPFSVSDGLYQFIQVVVVRCPSTAVPSFCLKYQVSTVFPPITLRIIQFYFLVDAQRVAALAMGSCAERNQRYYLKNREAILKRRKERREKRRELGIQPPRRRKNDPLEDGPRRGQPGKKWLKSSAAMAATDTKEKNEQEAARRCEEELMKQKLRDIDGEDKYTGYESRVAILKANEPTIVAEIDEMIKRHHGVLWKDQPLFNPWRQALHVEV